MDMLDFYSEQKWCDHCENYVPFLMSVNRSYCARCGKEVRLFSKKDWEAFHTGMENNKPGAKKRKTKAS